MKIIDTIWFTGIFGCIGIVIGEEDFTKRRKAYISTSSGDDEEGDALFIASHGSPVTEAQAIRLAGLLKEVGNV